MLYLVLHAQCVSSWEDDSSVPDKADQKLISSGGNNVRGVAWPSAFRGKCSLHCMLQVKGINWKNSKVDLKGGSHEK